MMQPLRAYQPVADQLVNHRLCRQEISEIQKIKGDSQSISTEGYSGSVSKAKNVGYNDSAWTWWSKAINYFSQAGYKLQNRMKRGGDFYSDDYAGAYER